MVEAKTQEIARLNDEFRKLGKGHGRLMITSGIQALGALKVQNIVEIMKKFDNFSSDNDPYEEHDFGNFQFDDQKIFWKFDYYASEDLQWGCEDPSDPKKCYRILTIMLVCEW